MDIKEKNRKYYEQNREKKIEYQMERYNTLLGVYTRWKKTLKCSMCGESDHNCLDFHHIDPNEKEIKISTAIGRGAKTVVNELKKCVVVCANCHRKVHAYNPQIELDVGLSKSFEQFLTE
jgi:predicted HNH restriction endonuclease